MWAYDFVFDACANEQTLKCLTVVDEYTREALAIDVAGRIRSARVIEVLARLVSVHGAPRVLRSDNGPEFVSRAILRWLLASGIDTAHIDPGKPWQNGLDESFNGKFRDECLNVEWFRNRHEAMVLIEQWRQHYNAVRPHSSLGYRTPLEYKATLGLPGTDRFTERQSPVTIGPKKSGRSDARLRRTCPSTHVDRPRIAFIPSRQTRTVKVCLAERVGFEPSHASSPRSRVSVSDDGARTDGSSD